MYINGSAVSSRRSAAVFTSVGHLTVVNHQHTHQHSVCGLLAHGNPCSRVRLNLHSSPIPVDVIGSLMVTRRVTDESDGISQLHVGRTSHLHHCTVITADYEPYSYFFKLQHKACRQNILKTRKPCCRREDRAMPLRISTHKLHCCSADSLACCDANWECEASATATPPRTTNSKQTRR